MSDKIVEPSEIIIDGKGLPKEKVNRVNPPIRFLARFFDYALFLLVLLFIRTFVGARFPESLFEYMIPFEYFAWIPIETALLCTLGITPGKFLLHTKITHGRKARFDFVTAFRRSFNVWLRGLGMGIPVINILCMLVASSKLRMMGMTTWDREDNITIAHYPVSQIRVIVASIITFIGFVAYYARF
ncbi:MAG TPA: RDD family protein [Chlamydiales bacterium]|nr:RDD family protein [Chlamydiales bacterium]